MIIELEQAIEKADYKCGKSFYLDPILDTYKKKTIENPIVEKNIGYDCKSKYRQVGFWTQKNNQ